MKRFSIGFILVVLIAVGAWAVLSYRSGPAKPDVGADAAAGKAAAYKVVASATYSCDKGKKISAIYFEGPAAPKPAPGEPPIPTSKAEVSLDGSASSTLMQTLSASGIRYANRDESLVFWSKGDEALIMRNNSMDLSYTNCSRNR